MFGPKSTVEVEKVMHTLCIECETAYDSTEIECLGANKHNFATSTLDGPRSTVEVEKVMHTLCIECETAYDSTDFKCLVQKYAQLRDFNPWSVLCQQLIWPFQG